MSVLSSSDWALAFLSLQERERAEAAEKEAASPGLGKRSAQVAELQQQVGRLCVLKGGAGVLAGTLWLPCRRGSTRPSEWRKISR